ncbi:Alpha/Beta hydrolase protein [Cercophora scortea]|uniref:Alpha/Beta hydrolase protein n=1 Tax=Cercophora scortea TaxID=314031 RepID=A0AAE0I2Z8_9PEZI|nr:Alpha/Beta hydrolase protein [Cercophora scortea]
MGSGRIRKYTSQNLGLFVLPPPEPNWEKSHGRSNLDIVAVHGLNGDATHSWTDESPSGASTMWLRDLLPYKLPNARVMTFGYNASVIGNTSVAGVRENARRLLSLLRDKREEEEDDITGSHTGSRGSIVFVGHSLGGIVIKQALRIANNESGSFSDIAESTTGIVFFGTPHRGADAATWASLVAGITTTAFGRSPKSVFLRTLKPNSRDLMDISEDFRPISTKYAIASFVETDVFSGLRRVVVERYSAVMELAHEEAVIIAGNHSTMCKFSRDDPRFDTVWKAIKRVSHGPFQIEKPRFVEGGTAREPQGQGRRLPEQYLYTDQSPAGLLVGVAASNLRTEWSLGRAAQQPSGGFVVPIFEA